MTHALQSYSEGRWQDGTGEQRRAVRYYLQRTAVQGHPDLLAALVPDGTQGSEGER